jgi:hypothetical protein
MLTRSRRLPILLIVLVITAVLLIFFLVRRSQAAAGPALALCPGPDLYGYTCDSGSGFAYIDATIDTQLYEDDGSITLELPFPFTFYGTTYTEVEASSNGTLQFGTANPSFFNECLNLEPAADMGDLIAPFWDDLDLTLVGYLEYDTVGTAPDRIFVVEWDAIPPFQADLEDVVTFEVQLFEGSNDIVFLYEDVQAFEHEKGRSATIGLQSELQGLSLQYSCNQPVVADTAGLYFPHPEKPNREVGQETVIQRDANRTIQAKGDVADLITRLDQEGPPVLSQLRSHWLSQSPARATEWRWADVTGNGRDDLIFLWHSTVQYPHLSQLVILGQDATGQMNLLFDQRLSTREESFVQMAIVETADLTHDNQPDILLQDEHRHQLFLLTYTKETFDLITVPQRCDGSLAVLDVDGDGRLEIARDGCEGGRVLLGWNGRGFTQQ